MAGGIVLVKLGGSLITVKSRSETPRRNTIARLAREIAFARSKGARMVVGHGGGSFPHRPAKRFRTHEGFSGRESARGVALVQDAASRLNRIVVAALLRAGVDAVSFQPSAFMLASGCEISSCFAGPIDAALRLGLTPVPFGDVAFDARNGCCIASTERILRCIARGRKVERIVVAGTEDGVWRDYPEKKGVFGEITPRNFEAARRSLRGSECVDVTGGMLDKVEELLAMSGEAGAPAVIVNGNAPGRLASAILGKKVAGTLVRA
jgi:isopentenyl phosphate kinase